MHLNELEQLNGAHNKQVTELENQISQLQVCTALFIMDNEGLKRITVQISAFGWGNLQQIYYTFQMVT